MMPPSNPEVPFDHRVRVISIFATGWRFANFAPHPEPDFDLGRLTEFYPLIGDQLPQVVARDRYPSREVALTAADDTRITSAEVWLFALPSDQIVAALDLGFESPDLNVDPSATVRVLESTAYADVTIGQMSLAQCITGMARQAKATPIGNNEDDLPPERHQIVFAPEAGVHAIPADEIVKRILYRVDPPYREEFLPIDRPAGLNQEQRSLCAVTPYVSLIYGHDAALENSVFLTAVQAVGTAARFRQIWRDAYKDVRWFRSMVQSRMIGQQRRGDLEILSDRLGNHELELSFSVETSADLGLLIPSLRIGSFYLALYDVMELPVRAEKVSRMFTRLEASIRSELTAIDIRERRDEEDQRLRFAGAASAVGFVVAPAGFLLAFFGINAIQVSNQYSIFDWLHYRKAYEAAAVIAILPLLVFAFLYGRDWLRARRDRRQAEQRANERDGEPMPEGLPNLPAQPRRMSYTP